MTPKKQTRLTLSLTSKEIISLYTVLSKKHTGFIIDRTLGLIDLTGLVHYLIRRFVNDAMVVEDDFDRKACEENGNHDEARADLA